MRAVPKDDRAPIAYTVLSARAIWLAFAAVVVAGDAPAVWLLLAYGRGDTQQRNQLEAIKTAGTVILGTGGAAASLLAARRQRAVEIAVTQKDNEQRHQERTAAATEADAAARRITELRWPISVGATSDGRSSRTRHCGAVFFKGAHIEHGWFKHCTLKARRGSMRSGSPRAGSRGPGSLGPPGSMTWSSWGMSRTTMRACPAGSAGRSSTPGDRQLSTNRFR